MRALAAVVLVVAACSDVERTAPDVIPVSTTSNLETCGDPIVEPVNFIREFECGDVIDVVAPGYPTAAVQQAISTWNIGLLSGENDLPFLQVPSGPPAPRQISVTFSGAGRYWCGETNIATNAITIHRSASSTNCGNGGFRAIDSQDPETGLTESGNLLAHELGHALGFDGHFVAGPPVYQNIVVRYCVNVVPPNFPDPFNGSICEHERQRFYQAYGLRPLEVAHTKLFVTAVTLTPGSANLAYGANVTFTPTLRVMQASGAIADSVPRPADQFDWSATPAGVVSVPPQGTSALVTAGTAPGSTSLTSTLSATSRFNFMWPLNNAADAPIAVLLPPPTNLSVSAITSTSGLLSWTNGDGQANTETLYRVAGTQTWSSGGTAVPGATSATVGGLSSCTRYDVGARHARNGILSTTVEGIGALRTTGGSSACPPANFHLTQCTWFVQGGTTYRTYHMGWTQGDFSFKSRYEIGQTSTDNPAGATIVRSGSSSSVADSLGPYPQQPGAPTVYLWIRHTFNGGGGPSIWIALADGPIQLGWPC